MIPNLNAKSNICQLAAFRKQYPIESGWSIVTECLTCDSEKLICKALIKNPTGAVVATGHAEAKRDNCLAVETAENKAIIRAIAIAGFANQASIADEPAVSVQPAKTEEIAPAAQPAQEQAKQEPVEESDEPDQQTAEKWVCNNLNEWLDQPAPFAKATGRTWRQLGQNVGNKIEVKGKSVQPRAYLHSIETWQSCNVWFRVKAKVALQICKNSKATPSHYAHPIEIGA